MENTTNNLSQVTPEPEKNENFFKKCLLIIWDFLKIIVIAAVIVLPIRYFLFQPFIVKGESMVPNFHSGDYLIIDEISYRFKNPQRGDVVVLRYPLDASQRFIKRVIGMPEETVDIKNGKITISKGGTSFLLDESYLASGMLTDGNVHVVLGDGKYFVMGDNRPFSFDSRRWGVLPREDIIGKALIRVFPLADMDLIDSPSY